MDGIVFHQIIQWHNMLSNKVPPVTMTAMKYNMMWDGYFHLFTWVLTLTGILLTILTSTAKEWKKNISGFFSGAFLLGWGLFNLVEGFINHQLLGLHNVREAADPTLYNIAFLFSGAVLISLGLYLMKKNSLQIDLRKGVKLH